MLLFSRSNSLQPHGLQHAKLLCPSPSPGACPLSRWCHPTISSSVVPFSSSCFISLLHFILHIYVRPQIECWLNHQLVLTLTSSLTPCSDLVSFKKCEFFFGCAGSLLLCGLFSNCSKQELHSSCGAWASLVAEHEVCGIWTSGRRQWPPTPVFLPGKSHGRRSLVGCSPWGR